jgi:4-amino-4-deoxy-L-arabinose transferase-like glycosyltransferase
VLGTITVALIGLVALELFGAAAAWIALVLAAIYPVLIELSATLVAENLLTPLVLGAAYAGLRVRRAGKPLAAYAWVAGSGVLTGLATLTHENAALIILPLLAAVWTTRPRLSARALAAPALLIATAAVTVAPWTIRNALVMHRFIPVSDETGITLVGTYNVASAANRSVPYKWRIFYAIPGERPLIHRESHLTEPEIGAKLQSQALHYIAKHPFSPFVVAFHNTLRLLELEGTFAWHAAAAAQSIPTDDAGVGVVSFWILCLLALGGAFSKAVRAAPKWVWVVPLLLAVSVVLVNVETPRFRAPVDPFLVLLASAALARAAGWVGRRLLGDRAPVWSKAGNAVAARPAELIEMRERLA